MPFPAPADTYPAKEAVADYLRAYADAFDLPVRLNARVTALSRIGDGFEVRTGGRGLLAPGRWWWPPDRSRSRSSHRPASGWTAR